MRVLGEEVFEVSETGHFEDFGFAEYDFSIPDKKLKNTGIRWGPPLRGGREGDVPSEGDKGAVGGHDDWAVGDEEFVLDDGAEVIARCVGLSNGAGGQVEEVVSVVCDVGE
jgi:hypothetical protein